MDRDKLMELYHKMVQDNDGVTTKDDRVLIVDGLNLFIRSFAGNPKTTHCGVHVGGCYGFINSLFTMIRKYRSTRCIVVFDGKSGSDRRRAIYPEYKSGRKSLDRYNRYTDMESIVDESESFIWQLSKLSTFLDLLPITTLMVDDLEADDVIGYLTRSYYTHRSDIVIVSSDNDFLQLLNDNVRLYTPTKRREYVVGDIQTEYGVLPENYLTMKVCIGDTSDSIRGITGIGKSKLLKYYPDISQRRMTYSDILDFAKLQVESGSKLKVYTNMMHESAQLTINFQLMDLLTPYISENHVGKIREVMDAPVRKFNKIQFRDAFFSADIDVDNFDSWVLSSLNQLDLYAETV